MTLETKRSLWNYLRGLLIGFLVGFGVNTSYWSHRVHDIAKTEEAVQRQLASVQRFCEGKWPFRSVAYQSADPSAIQILVLEGPRLIIKIPNVAKPDLANIVSDFFSRGDDEVKAKFEELLPKAKQITLIVTTESGKAAGK